MIWLLQAAETRANQLILSDFSPIVSSRNPQKRLTNGTTAALAPIRFFVPIPRFTLQSLLELVMDSCRHPADQSTAAV